jgi:ribosomal protein S4E
VFAALDSCLVNIIRKFINRSWRFMDAYRVPLSGKAAAWAVRKQKGHHTISQSAMMHLDAITNPT